MKKGRGGDVWSCRKESNRESIASCLRLKNIFKIRVVEKDKDQIFISFTGAESFCHVAMIRS